MHVEFWCFIITKWLRRIRRKRWNDNIMFWWCELPSGAHNSGYGEWHPPSYPVPSWATLSPGVINTETWSSRLGVGRGANNPTPQKTAVTKPQERRPRLDMGCRAVGWMDDANWIKLVERKTIYLFCSFFWWMDSVMHQSVNFTTSKHKIADDVITVLQNGNTFCFLLDDVPLWAVWRPRRYDSCS
jgi:hypothetical protein